MKKSHIAILATLSLVGMGTCTYNNMARKEVCETYQGYGKFGFTPERHYVFDPKPRQYREGGPRIVAKAKSRLSLNIGEEYCFTVRGTDPLGIEKILDEKSVRRK